MSMSFRDHVKTAKARMMKLGGRKKKVDPRQTQNDQVPLRTHVSHFGTIFADKKEDLVVTWYNPDSGECDQILALIER